MSFSLLDYAPCQGGNTWIGEPPTQQQHRQTLTITEFSEHECHELIPAGEALCLPITIILANKIIEVISVEKRCQLCENEFVLEHM